MLHKQIVYLLLLVIIIAPDGSLGFNFQDLSKLPPIDAFLGEDLSSTEDKKVNIETNSRTSAASRSYVPTDILDKLRNVKTLKDFVKNFKPEGIHQKNSGKIMYLVHKSHKDSDVHGKIGHDYNNEVQLTEPKDFSCKPRPKIIPVPADYSAIFWPSCVELDQCGGCCFNSAQFECIPSALANRSTTVFRIPLDGSNGSSAAPYDVHMVHHAACKCQCRVRPKDCLPTQTYDGQNCQCDCKRDAQKCPYLKQWSKQECRCACKYIPTCPKRYVFDEGSCRCKCKRSKCRKGMQLDPSTCRCVGLMFPYKF